MKKINSIEDALSLFEIATTKRGEALSADDFKTYNKYLPTVNKCILYLYDHQQLQLLCKYLTHDNYLVRSTAAYVLLPLYEKECIRVLSEIVNGDYGVQCLNAKRILTNWENGDLTFPYQVKSDKKSTLKQKGITDDKACNNEESDTNRDFPPEILRLSQIFGCPPDSDTELRNEDFGFYVKINREAHVHTVNVNTFVNPYTQDVVAVYQERLRRFKAFGPIATITAEHPSKLGFMKIIVTVPMEKATDHVLMQMKDTIYSIYNEWKPNESLVWFKADYNGAECYFEGEWWMPTRAVIKSRRGYERYDFSDEAKYDEEMWEIVQGEYDEFENSNSFALIDGQEFQDKWDATELNYKPKPY